MTVLKANRQRSVSNVSLSDLSETRPDRSFVPNPALRGLFAGSGSDCLSDVQYAKEILKLVRPKKKTKNSDATAGSTTPVNVLYLGTATYDLAAPRERQTSRFAELGCSITSLDVADKSPSRSVLSETIGAADLILVSGGNTLYAVDRWTRLGMVGLLREASERGAVLSGGSAGAIWVFDSGHSDSADPDTFRTPMLGNAAKGIKKRKGGPKGRNDKAEEEEEEHQDESSAAPKSEEEKKDWRYCRVNGLGFLPGLCCPHNDMVQSNGVLRSDDFDTMLLRHDGERGIGIDHWAALCIEGERYRVISPEDRPGSVVVDEVTGETRFCPDRTGRPGVWIKEVVGGVVEQWVCPSSGKVSDLLRYPTSIVEDTAALARCRRMNPDVAPPVLAHVL